MEDLQQAKRRLMDSLRKEITDPRVVEAMEKVPREAFVPIVSQHLSYEDMPLPIGEGQTISQPYIVALMTEALELGKTDRVLELGTGSGYQTAILAKLAGRVISVERIRSLADTARTLLGSLGYKNVEVHLGGETLGWLEDSPYQAIIVTAGSRKLPKELLDQLASGGRMVIPVGSMREQELMKIVKSNDGYSIKTLGPCRFVPLIGEGAWPDESEAL